MNVAMKCFAILCLCAAYAAPGVAEDYKIGTVNAIRVLQQSPQTELANSRIEGEFSDREDRIMEAQKILKALEERLEKDRAVLSAGELQKIERDIIGKRRELQRDQDEYREDLNFRRDEELAKMRQIIGKAIQDVAKAGGFDLVLSDGVVYSSDALDISEDVLAHLRKEQGKN